MLGGDWLPAYYSGGMTGEVIIGWSVQHSDQPQPNTQYCFSLVSGNKWFANYSFGACSKPDHSAISKHG